MPSPIELSRVCITEKNLNVCDNTFTYLNETLPEKVNVKIFAENLEALCAEAKRHGVKIRNKGKAIRFLLEHASQYEQEYAQYLNMFNDISKLAKALFVDNPLFDNTSENKDMQALYLKRSVMKQLRNSATVFSKFNYFHARINALKRTLDFVGQGRIDMQFYF